MPSNCHLNICNVCMASWNISLLDSQKTEQSTINQFCVAYFCNTETTWREKGLFFQVVLVHHGRVSIEQFISRQLGGREVEVTEKKQAWKGTLSDPLSLNRPCAPQFYSLSEVGLKTDFQTVFRLKDDGDIWSWVKFILHCGMATSLWGPKGEMCDGLNENVSHRLICLHA